MMMDNIQKADVEYLYFFSMNCFSFSTPYMSNVFALKTNVVLSDLLLEKSKRLPRVGSKDGPFFITNSCKSNSSHMYHRTRQLCAVSSC